MNGGRKGKVRENRWGVYACIDWADFDGLLVFFFWIMRCST